MIGNLISNMPKNEIYDVTFKCPFNCIMSGSSGSGKTTRLLEFLQLKDVICNAKFYKIYYFYSSWQGIYNEMKLQKLVDYFVEGIPDHESLMSMIDNNAHQSNSSSFPDHQLLIFDDLLCDIVSRKDDLMQKLFTVYSNHKKLSVIMLSQMLFKPGDYKFNVLSENVHYLFLFKSPRNSSKIIHLAKQVSPYDNKFIVQSYKEATSKEFTYLLFDFHQSTPERVRLRSKIFPSQGTMTVHMNESRV